ncbi:ABSCISIC ACID-INSENSITIVE 5-like protein 7 [Zingiber officinale]|uniref:ABSCISIC ACID-INSENSITIVE 5-like protein 7 n=1 Tax=Zingiber officinale TaxID=94328 RepID=UPI001C4DA9D7|nr:ABSCISIC ACID-INSENSITIVE 5-like protein 7 [Zingiber officinale]
MGLVSSDRGQGALPEHHNMNIDELLTSVMGAAGDQPMLHRRKWSDLPDQQMIVHEFGESAALDEFLIRSGGINLNAPAASSSKLLGVDPVEVVQRQQQQQEQWLQYQLHANQQQQHNLAMLSAGLLDSAGLAEAQQLLMQAAPQAMDHSFMESSATSEAPKAVGKRCMDERKQKRMLKNRESAARSRARKQAYVRRLEEELEHLKKTNHMLRKQVWVRFDPSQV